MPVEWIEGFKIVGRNAMRFYSLHREVLRLEVANKSLEEKNVSLEQQLTISQNNYKELEARPNTPNAEFVGWYRDKSGLMPQITLFLKEILEHREDASITIALDFAAYGAITWNEHFNQQESVIRSLSERGRAKENPVTIIVNSNANNKSVIESQYTDSVYNSDYNELIQKLKTWTQSDVFAALTSSDTDIEDIDANSPLDKIRNAIKNSKRVTKALFITSFLRFNERLIDRYRDAGALIVVRENLVPLHGWFYVDHKIDTEGIIGIVDVKAVWNEPGFRVRSEVALKIKQLIDQFARKSNGF